MNDLPIVPTCDLNGFVRGRLAHTTKDGREIFAIDIFHGDKVQPIGFSDVVNAADIGMRNLSCDPHLVMESLELVGVVRKRRRKELERDRLPQLQIVRPIDLPHAALAEKTDYAVTLREHRARRKPGLVDGTRR